MLCRTPLCRDRLILDDIPRRILLLGLRDEASAMEVPGIEQRDERRESTPPGSVRTSTPSCTSRCEQQLASRAARYQHAHRPGRARSGQPSHGPAICTITLAELSVGPLVARSPRERAARQALLQQAEADFEPFPFDASAARAFGSVTASLRQAGRKPAARAFDALIAAVAVSQNLPLYTANPADFAHIDGLEVRAVSYLKQQ
uniref:type II toxin-antitoxin system VapC family toxin n=1 Tax=Tessaracoccus timonensis TaxID=2161816 RepID=UPI0018D4E170|nr:type II toxin-antitoxin system VapC family toxin [Tessaracoccus timonensis]